jgi:uncharacterized membrane protein
VQMDKKTKIFYAILIISSILSTVFWTVYASGIYHSFNDSYYDIGLNLQNLYLAVNYPSVVHGLQYLVFANHISPDELFFVLPIFYIYRSPLTPFFIQALVLSFTSVLVFFVAKELTNNEPISFAMAIAYLLNPGMQGMLYFDFHQEFLIIPFAILTFYFYMKLNKKLFYLFLFLLLCTIDSVVFTVASIGIGLLYYEIIYDKDKEIKKERLKLLLALLLCCVAAFAFYLIYYNALIPKYATNYNNLSPTMYVIPFDSLAVSNVFHGIVFWQRP